MHSINPTQYGLELKFSGMIQLAEMREWSSQSKVVLVALKGKKFNVLIDMSSMGPLPQDAKKELEVGQNLYAAAGMARSAVIMPSLLVSKQLHDVARASAIVGSERYLPAEDPRAREKALAWVTSGIEPGL